MLPAAELALNLATALAAGLLIGAERGWRARDTDDLAGIYREIERIEPVDRPGEAVRPPIPIPPP